VGDTGSDKQVYGQYHWQLEIPDISDALLFFSATPPSASLDAPDFKTWDANGNPVNSIGGGRQVTWSPVTISRGADTDMKLWEWFKQGKDQSSTAETKKDINLHCLDGQGNPMFTWALKGAMITQFSFNGASAQSNEILVNTIEIKYEDADLTAG
jgi:phage tail-like protein